MSNDHIIQTSGYFPPHNAVENSHKLFYTIYEANNVSRIGTILILHGMQEHSGRYRELAEFLAEKGFVVLTYDHLGHGRTASSEEDLGYFKTKNPTQQLVQDALIMAQYLDETYIGLPHILLGHSMGSFIARCLLQEESKRFDAAIIVGTGGKTVGAGVFKLVLSALNIIAPRRRSKLINSLFAKMNNRRFKKEEDSDGSNWLSLSKTNRLRFQEDPLNGVPFTNNGFYVVLSLNLSASQRKKNRKIDRNLPMLFISGKDDPIGKFGEDVKKIVREMKEDGFQDVRLELYPRMRHEILNEDLRHEVYTEIFKWLSEHV